MADLLHTAFGLLESECERQGHTLCGGTGECGALARGHRIEVDREVSARRFDVGRERLAKAGSPPEHSWSTSALMRTVLDLVLTPPPQDWLWRSVCITSALARLGERGISADAIMRSGFGKALIQRIFVDASMFWCASQSGEVASDEIPFCLKSWIQLLESEDSLTALTQPTIPHVVSVALAGAPGRRARDWLGRASVADLLGWKLTDYLDVTPSPDEMVIAGGKDATHWLCDRFTKTYVDEWRLPSVQWELAYSRDPRAVAELAGLPAAALAERVVTDGMLIESLEQRIANMDAVRTLEGDLYPEEVIAGLGSMVELGQVESARVIARQLFEAYPREVTFAVAYAFCSIPVDAAAARSILHGLQLPDPERTAIRTINMACCDLFDGDLSSAYRVAADLDTADVGSHCAWLWEPAAALDRVAVARYLSVGEWLGRLALLVEAEHSGESFDGEHEVEVIDGRSEEVAVVEVEAASYFISAVDEDADGADAFAQGERPEQDVPQ